MAVSGSIIATYEAWGWLTFGALLPNTHTAKVAGGEPEILRMLVQRAAPEDPDAALASALVAAAYQGHIDSVTYLLDVASVLGDKLGPMLFQLPPYFKKDLPVLRDFLALFPAGRRAAFEFRNPSWFDDEVYETLHVAGAALVVSDQKSADPPVVATASFGYLRLRDEDYDAAQLERWATRITEQPWESACVFFKHEDAGAGPKMAKQFVEILARVAKA